jgi:MoxR-like ATPase
MLYNLALDPITRTMALPQRSREAILEAMNRFDKEFRGTSSWQDWTENETHKYAVEHDDRLYPVKQIVSLATGIATADFSGGDEANAYVGDRGFSVVELHIDPQTHNWIFQSNPKYYDVVGAIKNLTELNWAVAQYKKRIHIGDRVFLWEVGAKAGIIGTATVTTEPGVLPVRQEEKPFIRDETAVDEARTNVTLRIDRVFESRLPRTEMVKDEILRTLGVIRFPNATNYALNMGQTRRLEELLDMSISNLKWERVTSDSYDLALQHVGNLDRTGLKALYEKFMSTKWADSDRGVNKYLREDFKEWVDAPEQPLKSRAYVTLSNWFLSIDAYKNDPRGNAARSLWDFLFLCRPTDRLSRSEGGRNHLILPDWFDQWWTEQLRLQGSPQAIRKDFSISDSRFKLICKSTYMPQSFFEGLEKVLLAKKQLILQGAPGTGKTFVTEKFAEWWAGSKERVKVIQFHESYGYEDFVYGIKPFVDPETHTPGFRAEPGIFLKVCDIAKRFENERFVLVIDEINRGKPSRIFGELLYLLEYRTKTVELQSGIGFSIPENLYLIGTMNTIDKSIAIVDYALRRRFAFETLTSVRDGRSVVLRPWMDAHNISNADQIERLFLALNKEVAAKDEALMIGHSYFISDEVAKAGQFSDGALEFIWRYYILPLVSEYEYDLTTEQVENKYSLSAIKRAAGLP